MSMPSLTPYRDRADAVLAQAEPAENWKERLTFALIAAVHCAIADERDAGVSQGDILAHVPKVLRGVAVNALSAVGVEDPLAIAPLVLAAAAGRAGEPTAIRTKSASLRTHGGGHA